MTRILISMLLLTVCHLAHSAPRYHAISMYGDIRYGENFAHFDYVNPSAAKGQSLRLAMLGTFDGFNPFIAKGSPAAGSHYLWDTLTTQSLDEPFTAYGLLAESIEMPDDRSWVTFHLRPQARFSDGKPVTAEDVKWTFETLLAKGRPFFSYYYGSVASVEVLALRSVRFNFNESENRELPLIIGQLPVLAKHFWQDKEFDQVSLQPAVGSGPYKLASADAGKRIIYQRRKDYWAKDLAVNIGHYNFDRIIYEYFLDETVILEAFKGGSFDFRAENSAKNWATAYQSPALRNGKIIKEEVKHQLPAGMQGFVYNLRRPMFQERTLREALSYALDFEWSNKNLFYNQYTRTRSYFDNSSMASQGLPEGKELSILTPFRKQLPSEVFEKNYTPPQTNGTGSPRKNLRHAQALLKKAGYAIKNNQLYNANGTAITFEILLRSPAFERIALPFARNLKLLGVHANVRKVDPQQYIERIREFDFDMIVGSFGQSNSPGNEQRDFWSSAAAQRPGSRNLAGIQDPVIDALVEKLISAPSREQLELHCRALDRVLQWGFYVIPHWHIARHRFAYRSTLAHPENYPPYGTSLDIWWHSAAE